MVDRRWTSIRWLSSSISRSADARQARKPEAFCLDKAKHSSKKSGASIFPRRVGAHFDPVHAPPRSLYSSDCRALGVGVFNVMLSHCAIAVVVSVRSIALARMRLTAAAMMSSSLFSLQKIAGRITLGHW